MIELLISVSTYAIILREFHVLYFSRFLSSCPLKISDVKNYEFCIGRRDYRSIKYILEEKNIKFVTFVNFVSIVFFSFHFYLISLPVNFSPCNEFTIKGKLIADVPE